MLIAVLIFGATLLLVPFIGGEFMPHLDEGALWVRATMPYTISFEEASKIAPQIRDILDVVSAGHGRSAPSWAVPTTAPIPPASSTASFMSA